MTLYCKVCKRWIDPADPGPDHDVVKRYNTKEGPGPFPYLILHRP